MTVKEQRDLLVRQVLTRERKNQYSQDVNKRTLIEKGFGDCSGTMWYWYRKLFGLNIGANTEAQIKSGLGDEVSLTVTAGVPDESKMQKGDLLYFRGSDNSRTRGVGHVEMYIGNGQIFGHGSGVGGTVKDMKAYCTQRYNQKSTEKLKNKGLICVKRFLRGDNMLESGNDIIWELMNGKHKVKITEVDRAVKALDKAKNNSEFSSLYWILYKLVNGNG